MRTIRQNIAGMMVRVAALIAGQRPPSNVNIMVSYAFSYAWPHMNSPRQNHFGVAVMTTSKMPGPEDLERINSGIQSRLAQNVNDPRSIILNIVELK